MKPRKIDILLTTYPGTVIAIVLGLTVYFCWKLMVPGLRWETDARVYFPKGHPAIRYDEQVDKVFGVKDAVIIAVVNEKKSVYNPVTLARIARITEQVAVLPGVIANRTIDVLSLSTASLFVGDETSIGAERLMEYVPDGPDAIARLKKKVEDNHSLFVGNIVSGDGTAAIIRARLREGIGNRYSTYWGIKGILAQENSGGASWDKQAQWGASGGQGNQWWAAGKQQSAGKHAGARWPRNADRQWKAAPPAAPAADNGDRFYLAGRPVIEVESGMNALQDMKVMVPLLIVTIMAVLYVIFRSLRGVLLPLFIVSAAVIWTLGTMAVLNIPFYTISTMLPVILVAIGIGDSVHLLGNYQDQVSRNPGATSRELVQATLYRLRAPLMATSVTTAIGFLSLTLAEMPPFRIFGLFTVLGILYSWLLTVTFTPAVLALLKPRPGKNAGPSRSTAEGKVARLLVGGTRLAAAHGRMTGLTVGVLIILAVQGSRSLEVDSSWMSDFRPDTDVAAADKLLNKRFDGTIFLNVVVEGRHPDALKSPEMLSRIEALQAHVDGLPYVGNSISLVDYLKSMNKNLHAGQEAYKVLPETRQEIAEYLFLLSMSGRPDELDEVVDYNYQRANVTFSIKTDHTRELNTIIGEVKRFAQREFSGMDVQVNLAGSANNSSIWAQLLIDSQTVAILFSKIGIFIVASFWFRSLAAGFLTIVPVSLTTLLMAGVAGLLAIPLDVSTALAAGVAIGVGVDYAIHYLFRYRDEWRISGDHQAATMATMRTAGKTIVFNASVVALGFLVLVSSRFPPHAKLGYFVAAYMLLSCLATLLVMPLLVRLFRFPAGGRTT